MNPTNAPAPDTIKYAVLEALTHLPKGEVDSPTHAVIEYLQRYAPIQNNSKQRMRILNFLRRLEDDGILEDAGIVYVPGEPPSPDNNNLWKPVQVFILDHVQPLPHGNWRGKMIHPYHKNRVKKVQTPSPKPAPVEVQTESAPLVLEEDLKQFGIDMIDHVIRVLENPQVTPNKATAESLIKALYLAKASLQ